MTRTVAMIGLSPEELPWIRRLVSLLRHPDPTIPELARQALLYLLRSSLHAHSRGGSSAEAHKNNCMVNCMK